MNGSSVCWTTRVGTRTVGRNCPHVHFGHQRHHERNGPRAGRQPFMSRPSRPDLLVPRHVRIDQACWNSPVPHMATTAARISPGPASSVAASDLRSPRARRVRGAGRMCRGEQRGGRERAATARRTASRLPRSSSTAVMLSAHCSKRRHRSRRDGIRCSRARLVEEDQPTERRHRLDPPLNRR